MPEQAPTFYEFAEFRLDPDQRALTRNGELVALTPKVFDTLFLLVQNCGRITEKEEMMKILWPESFVEEANLSQNISVLRKILGDDRNGNSFIQTIPRRGYRFVAHVRQVNAQADHGQTDTAESRSACEYWGCHSPFRGLQVFEPEDAWLFFGRDAETMELRDRLSRSPVVVVVGSSGGGKSSLVRAGLIPALQQGCFGSEDPIRNTWRIALFRPSGSPFDYLSEILPGSLAPALSPTEMAEFIADCRNKLPAGGEALRNAISALVAAGGGEVTHTRILLVADQFEEIFTLSPNHEVRRHYINALLSAGRLDSAIALHVILVLRADFYADCLEYPELSRCLEENLYNVPRMTPEQLREAIERRLALATAKTEAGLVETLLADVGTEPGDLALLEHALSQLWKRCGGYGCTITHRAYEEIGRIRGALSKHADEVYGDLPDENQQSLARRIFLELVHLGEGTPDTRRRVQKFDLFSLGDPNDVELVLARLAASRLISTGLEGNETVVEVSHEALIREWSMLREWIAQNREELRFGRRLLQAAQEWEDLSRESAALLHGGRLSQAQEWLSRHAEAHSLLHHFLNASNAAHLEAIEKERLVKEREHAEKNTLDIRIGRTFGGLFLMSVVIASAIWISRFEYLFGRRLGDPSLLTLANRRLWTNSAWLATMILQLTACWLVIRKRFYETWKAFTYYLVFEAIISVILFGEFLTANGRTTGAYFYSYCVFAFAEILFTSLVSLEILIKILNPLKALPSRKIAWFCFWAILCISVSIISLASQPSDRTWYALLLLMNTTIRLANGVLLFVVLFQVASPGLQWKSPVMRIALIYASYSVVHAITLFVAPGDYFNSMIENVSYLAALTGWVWVMFRLKPV